MKSKRANILNDLSETALITAIEANLFEVVPAFYGCLPNAVYQNRPDAAWFMSDIPSPLFNGVLHARLAPDSLEARIQEITANFKSRDKSMLWWTGPATRPDGLGDHLQACGLLHLEDLPGMAMDLAILNKDLPTNPAVTIKRVGGPDDLDQWVRLLATNFEVPRKTIPQLYGSSTRLGFKEQGALHHYLGLLNGEAVGTSTLYLGAGVAGLYNISTLPKARRKGVGTAVTRAPLLMARERGYRIGILHSTRMGYKVYQRLGFKEYCTIRLYLYLPKRPQRAFVKLYLWTERLIEIIRARCVS